MFFMSVLLLSKGCLPAAGWEHLSLPLYIVMYLLIGAVTGFLSGMLGVGGGGIMVPSLVILGGMGQHLAQGTSLLAMVPVSISGAWTHLRLGNVRTDISWGLAAGSVAGGYLGASAAGALPEALLRTVFAGVGIWVSLRFIRA